MSFQIRQINQKEKEPRKSSAFLKSALLLSATLAKPVYELYLSWKDRKEKEEKKQQRVAVLKRAIAILVALLLVALLIGVIAQTVFSVQFSLKNFLMSAGTELKHDEQNRVNLLLLGGGDDGHEGRDLLDTIIVASIGTGRDDSIVMLSLPRDMFYEQHADIGQARVNSLYRDYKGVYQSEGMDEEAASVAALEKMKEEIGTTLGLTIHYAVKVNFTAFEQVVDALGGIDITVPESLIDTLYPGPNYSYETFQIDAGPQTLDGATALKYARSRHSTSDFDRSARQQLILSAIVQKAKSLELHKDLGRITDLYQILSKNVQTDLALGEILSLAGMAGKFSPENVVTMQVNDQSGVAGGFVEPGGFLYTPPRDLFGGASVLLPVKIAGTTDSWKQLKTLTNVFIRKNELFTHSPRIAVLNAGAKGGTALLLGSELIRYGFDVVTIENYPAGETETSFIATRPPSADQEDVFAPHRTFLGESFGFTAQPYPTGVTIEESPDLLLVLGRDFVYRPLQDLLP